MEDQQDLELKKNINNKNVGKLMSILTQSA